MNESERSIEIKYEISESGAFDDPEIQSLQKWNERNSFGATWREKAKWFPMIAERYETNGLARTIRLGPKEVVMIEKGSYNPISEEHGDLTEIVNLTISSPTGEIAMKGKLLLSQFEKEDYTFIKKFRDDIKSHN